MSARLFLFLILANFSTSVAIRKSDLVMEFCANIVKAKQVVIFSCFGDKNDIFEIVHKLVERVLFARFVNLGKAEIDLSSTLTRHITVVTCVVLNLDCPSVSRVLEMVTLNEI